MHLFSHSEIYWSLLEVDLQKWWVYFETYEAEYDLMI